MGRRSLTDEEVEREIARLRDSKAVKLAKKEDSIRYKRRQYMYQLRSMERRGLELQAAGVTIESLEEMAAEAEQIHKDIW